MLNLLSLWVKMEVDSHELVYISLYSHKQQNKSFRIQHTRYDKSNPQTCRFNDVFAAAPTPVTTIYHRAKTVAVNISYLPKSSHITVSMWLGSFSLSIATSSQLLDLLNHFQPVAEQWGLKVSFTAAPLHKPGHRKKWDNEAQGSQSCSRGRDKQSSAGPLRSPPTTAAGVSLETSGEVGDGGTPQWLI